MYLNTKIIVTAGLLSGAVLLASMTLIQQQGPPPQQGAPQQGPPQQQQERKYTNLKVLPKHISNRDLGNIMNVWRRSLGVQCGFCHARNTETNQMDYASDAKPEKLTARKMVTMASKINSKYFDTKKDSIGMMSLTSVSCNTCHRGATKPEVALAAQAPRGGGPGGQGQGGQGQGGGQRPPGQGGQGGQGQGGQGGQGQGGGQRGGGNTTPPPPAHTK